MKAILIHVAEADVKLLDRLVSERKYPSRNEAIRLAIHDLINREVLKL